MITPTLYPPLLNPAFNPIPVVLETDNLVITPGSPAEFRFAFSGAVTAGESLQLEWLDNSVTFDFQPVPDDSGTQIVPTTGTTALEMQAVAASMRLNYHLSRDFIITYAGMSISGPVISLLAREVGVAFDITAYSLPLAGIIDSTTAAVDMVMRDRFRFIVHIQQELNYGSEDWDTVVILDPTPDAAYQVKLDLSEICRSYLQPDMPSFAGTSAQLTQLMRRRFRIQHAERYGSPEVYNALHSTDPFHAILCGIDATRWPGYDFPIRKRFLSYWPDGREKWVTETQHEYLYYLCDDNSITLLELYVEVTFTDGTNNNAIVATAAPATNDIWIFPSGYTQLNLAAIDPSRTVESYTLQLHDQGGDDVANLRLYRIDRHDWPQHRQLLWRNSLGGLETLALIGFQQSELETERQVTERVLPIPYLDSDAQYAQHTERVLSHVTARTGWHTPDVGRYWQDILIRAELWEVREDRYVPCLLETTKLAATADDQDLWALELKYYPAINLKSFTPI